MTRPVGLDANVLARYYVDDASDAHTHAQRERARKLIDSGQPLAVCKTALLELEWVLRGYYRFAPGEIGTVFAHLLSQPQLEVEDRAAVERAVASHAAGLDFADALHHASYAECKAMATFDDRRFARRAARLNLQPPVQLPR
jgi:predicted nucleic-acid-binding protein